MNNKINKQKSKKKINKINKIKQWKISVSIINIRIFNVKF